jgi:hypothetical protein
MSPMPSAATSSPVLSAGASSAASGQSASTTPTPAGSPALTGDRTILQLLALLPIAPEDRTGYQRPLFPTWIDADGDGCNTRYEVLIAESRTPVSIGSGCYLTGGTWYSAYDGVTVSTPPEISIDHVVALAEAWDSGASAWSAARREAFANDIDVPWTLIAVTPASNDAKSDLDPADWLPPRAADRCGFLADWVATKVRWSLSVDQREHDAIAGLASDCAGTTRQVVLASGGSLSLFGTPAPASPGICDPAYPDVCIPPPPPDLDCADIAYRRFAVLPPDPHHFDGDGDGIGCEG